MEGSSFPDSHILRTPPALDWGRPRFALPITPPDATASCPAPPRLRVCRRWSFESPRIPHPIGAPSGFQISSFLSTLFRPLRLSMHSWSRPQFLHLPALPAIDPRVAPKFVSFSTSRRVHRGYAPQLRLPSDTCRCIPRLPGSCTFRLCRRQIFELPRISRPSAPPLPVLTVARELRRFRLRLLMKLRVAPHTSSSGLALGLSLRVAPAPLSLSSG